VLDTLLNALATPVGVVLRTIHELLSTLLAADSGPAWGLSIVLLTIVVRLVLFPLFVKQIKSQRRMQQIAPQVKELQKKHKGDRETLNAEMMKLYKTNNANPISGCLPLILQLPVFFALFTVVREFKPGAQARYGLTSELLQAGGAAKIFGAPISTQFTSSAQDLATYGGSSGTVRTVALIMIVLMGATTFWTQRQMMARAGVTDPQQVMVQKLLLYVLPLSFAVFGINFPIGVLLYWLTTNIWSMGQQAWVIKRMPPVVAGADAGAAPARSTAAGKGPGKGVGTLPRASAGADTERAAPPSVASTAAEGGGGGSTASSVGGRSVGAVPPAAVSAAPRRRPAGSRKNKKTRGRR